MDIGALLYKQLNEVLKSRNMKLTDWLIEKNIIVPNTFTTYDIDYAFRSHVFEDPQATSILLQQYLVCYEQYITIEKKNSAYSHDISIYFRELERKYFVIRQNS